jgi:hypothetical protein
VLSGQPSPLADFLMESLRRPVAAVAIADAEDHDFFEKACSHAP